MERSLAGLEADISGTGRRVAAALAGKEKIFPAGASRYNNGKGGHALPAPPGPEPVGPIGEYVLGAMVEGTEELRKEVKACRG